MAFIDPATVPTPLPNDLQVPRHKPQHLPHASHIPNYLYYPHSLPFHTYMPTVPHVSLAISPRSMPISNPSHNDFSKYTNMRLFTSLPKPLLIPHSPISKPSPPIKNLHNCNNAIVL